MLTLTGHDHRNRDVSDQRPNTINISRRIGHESVFQIVGERTDLSPFPGFAAQLLLAVHWPPYLNSGADLSWSLVAFMVAFQTLFCAS